MRIMIAGCKGMLGTDLSKVLNDGNEVIGYGHDEIDITDYNSVCEKTEDFDVVINCAAYTNVDACETDSDNAFRVNSVGARNLAVVCNKKNIPLVHISTDYVFDGTKKTPYFEGDATNPLNVYGKSKLFGEQHIERLCNKFFIIRTQWLFGKNGKNFVKTMLKLGRERSSLNVVNDQFGSPTYTLDLSKAISALIKTEQYGVYHITNSGSCSWFEFAQEIMKQAGLNASVNPCSGEEYKSPAKRPEYGVLENMNFRLSGFEPLRNYKEALKDYLNEEGVHAL